MSEREIKVRVLRKGFGGKQAVAGIDLEPLIDQLTQRP